MKWMLIMMVFYPTPQAPLYMSKEACEIAAKAFREGVSKQDKVIRNLAVCIPVEGPPS